jgi:hypothetical protein
MNGICTEAQSKFLSLYLAGQAVVHVYICVYIYIYYNLTNILLSPPPHLLFAATILLNNVTEEK